MTRFCYPVWGGTPGMSTGGRVLVVARRGLPTDPMRILYMNYEWDRRGSSGAARHINELTKGLGVLGHEVLVRDRHLAPEVSPGTRSSSNGGPGLRKTLSRFLHEPAALARAVAGLAGETALIRSERPDVVLTRYSLHRFSSLLAARRCGVPVVFEVNAPVAYEYRTFKRGEYSLLPGFPEWSESATLSRSDGLFVVSNQLKEHFVARGVPAELIRVIPNGVDTEVFRPGLIDESVRARFGDGKTVVGFVGSFANFHGIDSLREAIRAVTRDRPDVVFLMVGHSKLASALQAGCASLGVSDRVHFTGYVTPDRVPALMGSMDILLAPYAAQKFFYMSPIKIFEYMACGRAIVAASVGQVAELIEDGKTGVLYNPSEPRALTEKLLSLINDPLRRAALGEAARDKVVANYTWQHNASRVAGLLEDAVARGCEETA